MIEAIRSALENDGLATVTARLAEIQNGTLDLVAWRGGLEDVQRSLAVRLARFLTPRSH